MYLSLMSHVIRVSVSWHRAVNFFVDSAMFRKYFSNP